MAWATVRASAVTATPAAAATPIVPEDVPTDAVAGVQTDAAAEMMVSPAAMAAPAAVAHHHDQLWAK